MALVALVALVAGLVSGKTALVPLALVLVGGIYAAELVAHDAPLDAAAPVFAAGLLVAAELAYWSLDERPRIREERGDGWRHLAQIACLGVVALLSSAVLLGTADVVRVRGVGVDVAGAAAAALALLTIVLFARGRGSARD